MKRRMTCQRCRGFMIPEALLETWPPEPISEVWRCINCGDIVDSTVLHNRRTEPPPVKHSPHHRGAVLGPIPISNFNEGRRSGEDRMTALRKSLKPTVRVG